MAAGAADLVDPLMHLLDARELEVRDATFVDGAFLATLGARAVVGHHDHHRVVRLPEVLDEVEHPPDLVVRVGEEGGKALHEALGQLALPLVE